MVTPQLRILSVIRSEIGACEAYRVLYPHEAMHRKGHVTMTVSHDQLIDLVQRGVPFWDDFDLVTFQRILLSNDQAMNSFSQMPLLLRGMGLSVVMDYDDDITDPSRTHFQGRIPDLAQVSAITVSTPYLKKRLAHLNRNVTVLPNLVPFQMFRAFRRLLPGPVVALTGSVTHHRDWEVLALPLAQLTAKFGFTLFVSGYLPDYLKGLPNLVTPGDFMPGLPKGEVSVTLADYGLVMANADIVLCPVDPEDEFNKSKSNLKAIEAQASARVLSDGRTGGCAVIASGDLPCYRDAVKHGSTGLLVDHHNQYQWERAIERLLTDEAFRRDLQVRGHENCKRFFDIEAQIGGRVAAYREILDRDRRSYTKTMAGVAALLQEQQQVAVAEDGT